MNPFEKSRNGYLAACSAFALAYAFLTGGNLPAAGRLTDGALYGVLLVLTGMILWNIFRYALSGDSPPFYRCIFIILLSVLAAVGTVGIETAALYFCFPEAFGETLASVPLRLFVTLLGLIIFRLYCLLPATEKPSAGPHPVSHPPEPAPAPAAAVERITVRNGQKIKIIPIEDILYLQADGDYVSIRTAEGRWLKEQTMKYSEEILPASRFIRIHRSYIVNITHISRIERYGEQQSIILHNGERIRISSARYQLLRRRLDI